MLLLSLIALAATPTPTLVPPTATPTATTTDEIQKIREVVQQKVKEKLKQITNPTVQRKGIIGKIIQIDNTQIAIEYQGNIKSFTVDDTTTYVDLNRNKSNLEKLKIGQDILALVIEDSIAKTIVAKRIVVSDLKLVVSPKTVVVGKIVDISKSSPIFTLIPSNNKNNLFQIKTDTKTQIITSKDQKLSTANLSSGHKIIAILTPDPKMNKTYSAIKIIDLDYSPSPTPTPKP